jgi:hypothetical protein
MLFTQPRLTFKPSAFWPRNVYIGFTLLLHQWIISRNSIKQSMFVMEALWFFFEAIHFFQTLFDQLMILWDCYYSCTALRCCALDVFSVFWSYTQSVGLLWRGISPYQGLYLHTEQHKHRINAHTDIHALSGVRTHDPGVRVSEDSSCLSAATVIGGIMV